MPGGTPEPAPPIPAVARALADASGVLQGVSHTDAIAGPLSFVGDVDGDGRTDVAITGWSSGQRPVYVVSGAAMTGAHDEVSDVDLAVLTDPATTRRGGVLAAGDLDGDGHGDLWVGAPYRLVSGASVGTVDLTAATVVVNVGTGRSDDAAAGDLDGDGVADLVVSDDEDVLAFRGPFSGVVGPEAAELRVRASGGGRVATGTVAMGDLTGDGDVELVAGSNCGEESLADLNIGGLDGDMTGTVALAERAAFEWWIECPRPGRAFEAAVLGDVDGDGHADLGLANEHHGFVLHGPLSGAVDPTSAAVVVEAEHDGGVGEYLHGAPVSPGDVDGDGLAEVAFAAHVRAVPQVGLIRGSRSGVVDEQGWDEVFAATTLDAERVVVRAGGDATGDGIGDLLVGAPPSSDPSAVGHAWLLSGVDILQ